MGNKKSFTQSLAAISNAINGALNSELVLSLLSVYGYTEERIRTEGVESLEEVKKMFAAHQREYGEQYAAYEVVNNHFAEAYAYYMPHLRISRIALKNQPGALYSIRATGGRKRSISGFIKEGGVFYRNLLEQPQYMEAMGKFNIKKEDLEKGLLLVNNLEKSHLNYLKEKGEAQDLTIQRDKAYDELYDWYSEFRTVARIALAERPQLLEQLGIIVKR